MTYTPGQDPWNASADTELRLADLAPPRKRRRGPVIIVVVIAALVIAGGAGIAVAGFQAGTKPATHPSPTCDVIGINGCTTKQGNGGGNVQYSPDAAQALPASVKQACDLNEHMRAAQTDGDLRGQGATINQIHSLAGSSTIFEIRFAVNMLKDRYDLAVAAKGGDLAFSTTVDLLTASVEMSTACLGAGWRKS